jgi:hypothetical protein
VTFLFQSKHLANEDSIHIDQLTQKEVEEDMEKVNKYTLQTTDFEEKNPGMVIEDFKMDSSSTISIVEYSPKIFRSIRQDIISSEDIFKSLIPRVNFHGIHNFSTGDGKSPSFFFFSDNRLIMLKTLKDSEMSILYDDKFLPSYYSHVMKHKDSLLSRLLGVY